MNSTEFFGIDFGTTNTAMVYFSTKKGKIFIGDERLKGPLPSVVALNQNTGEVIVGSQVKQNIKTLEEDYQIILSVKTILDDPLRRWNAGGKVFTPMDVAAEIFRAIKKNALSRNYDISETTIAVPVNFSAEKKRCLKNAAEKVDIKILKFISEPTAAFLAHYEELKSYSNIVVFDWGGGTLDISALDVKGGTIKEVYTDNMYRAGDDIDREFARRTYEKSIKQFGLKLIPFDNLPSAEYDELITKAENAKIELSVRNKNEVRDICTIQSALRNITFSYDDLQNVSADLVDEAIHKLANVIKKAFSGKPGCILCVGGSCGLRLLREEMAKIFGDILYFPDEPQWDIADGACTVSASQKNNIYKLSSDISLKLSNNDYVPLLQTGQSIPCKPETLYLSTTDCKGKANFIFRIGKYEEEPIVVPVLGGVDEVLKISIFVDEYNVLYVNLENQKTKDSYNIFKYEKLDITYNV